jgi:hypothetical protein
MLPALGQEESMPSSYRVAGIDVHKNMLAVVVSDVAATGEWEWERRTFGRLDSELRQLAEWLAKGYFFQTLYRRLMVRLGHAKAVWAVAHRLCRLVWKIPSQGVTYQEHGASPNTIVARQRTRRLIRQLQALGYQMQLTPITPA